MKRLFVAAVAICMASSFLMVAQADARGSGGCGSHGGPGYRKANGKCASWRD